MSLCFKIFLYGEGAETTGKENAAAPLWYLMLAVALSPLGHPRREGTHYHLKDNGGTGGPHITVRVMGVEGLGFAAVPSDPWEKQVSMGNVKAKMNQNLGFKHIPSGNALQGNMHWPGYRAKVAWPVMKES